MASSWKYVTLLVIGFLLSAAPLSRCDFLENSSPNHGRSLLSDGGRDGSAVDGTRVDMIVAERITDDKAVLRYHNDSRGLMGSSITFQVTERDTTNNELVMHTPSRWSRPAGVGYASQSKAALANVGDGKLVSCELTKQAVKCALLTVDDAANSVSVGSWSILDGGRVPRSIAVVGFESGSAIACYQIEGVGRNSSVSCRSITVASNELAFGPASVLTAEYAKYLYMARFDMETHSAFACYSDESQRVRSHRSNNHCRMVSIRATEVRMGNAVNLGERALNPRFADPCVVSRLNANQGLACCEKDSWISNYWFIFGYRSSLDCKVLFVSNSDQLSLSGGDSFPSSSLTVASDWGGIGINTMVHLKDTSSGSFGKTELCYRANSLRAGLTCDTVNVKESWSLLGWRNVMSLEVKRDARYVFNTGLGSFSLIKLKESNPADLLACYHVWGEYAVVGPGICKVLTR